MIPWILSRETNYIKRETTQGYTTGTNTAAGDRQNCGGWTVE